MAAKSRRKGARVELEIVHLLQDAGFAAMKISRTGYTGSDLSCRLLGADRKIECKARANGFKQLHEWLENAELLVLKTDRKTPLVVVPLPLWLAVAGLAEQATTKEKGNNERANTGTSGHEQLQGPE